MITNQANIIQILCYQIIQLRLPKFNNILHQKVGKRIQELRKEKKLSQQDLAAKCNFEKSNMSRLEAGGVNMTLSTMEKVSEALEVEMIELFRF